MTILFFQILVKRDTFSAVKSDARYCFVNGFQETETNYSDTVNVSNGFSMTVLVRVRREAKSVMSVRIGGKVS